MHSNQCSESGIGDLDAVVVLRFSLTPPLTLVNPGLSRTNLAFSFQTEAGQSYTVEYNEDLNPTTWKAYYTLSGDGSIVQSVMPMTNTPQRFFRVRQP